MDAPINLDEIVDGVTYLNHILQMSFYESVDDVPYLKEILKQAKNWNAYDWTDDNIKKVYSPLYWIVWHDENPYDMSIALIPWLEDNGYTLDKKQKQRIAKKVLSKWFKI